MRFALLTALCLLVASCVPYQGSYRSSTTYYGSPGPVTVSHAWVYYPDSDVYWCRPHGHYYRPTGGSWVYTERIEPVYTSGTYFEVEYVGDDPWIHVETHRRRHGRHHPTVSDRVVVEHAHHYDDWVFYPEHDVYYSQRNRVYYQRRGGSWIRTERYRPVGGWGAHYRIEDYHGAEPYHHFEVHVERYGHGRRRR